VSSELTTSSIPFFLCFGKPFPSILFYFPFYTIWLELYGGGTCIGFCCLLSAFSCVLFFRAGCTIVIVVSSLKARAAILFLFASASHGFFDRLRLKIESGVFADPPSEITLFLSVVLPRPLTILSSEQEFFFADFPADQLLCFFPVWSVPGC